MCLSPWLPIFPVPALLFLEVLVTIPTSSACDLASASRLPVSSAVSAAAPVPSRALCLFYTHTSLTEQDARL